LPFFSYFKIRGFNFVEQLEIIIINRKTIFPVGQLFQRHKIFSEKFDREARAVVRLAEIPHQSFASVIEERPQPTTGSVGEN
jgi:hypothetical protein